MFELSTSHGGAEIEQVETEQAISIRGMKAKQGEIGCKGLASGAEEENAHMS